MGIVTNIFNKGSDRILLSPDPHLAYCKRISELGTMAYSDLPSSQQREVDNDFSAVKKSTDNIVQASLVRDAARTRLKVLQIVNEEARKIVDTFDGCTWEKDIRDDNIKIFYPEDEDKVPGFILKDTTKVSLKVYDDIVHNANSRFGAIDLASAIKKRDGGGRGIFSDFSSAEDKVTLAGKNYNSSVGSFAPALEIKDPVDPTKDYYKSTFLFFHEAMGFLDSKCESSLIGLDHGGIFIPEHKSDGTVDTKMNAVTGQMDDVGDVVPITSQQTIYDRVSIARYLLEETQAKLESSDLSSAAYSDLFDFNLALEHNNRKHYAVRCEAPFTGIDKNALDANIEMIDYAKFKELEKIFIKLRNSYTLREILSRLKI